MNTSGPTPLTWRLAPVLILNGGLALVSLLYLVLANLISGGLFNPSLGSYWFIAPFLLVTSLSAWWAFHNSSRLKVSGWSRLGAVGLQVAVLGAYLFSISRWEGEMDLVGLIWGWLIGPITLVSAIVSLVCIARQVT